MSKLNKWSYFYSIQRFHILPIPVGDYILINDIIYRSNGNYTYTPVANLSAYYTSIPRDDHFHTRGFYGGI